jgi:hypothetical protein
MTTPARSYNPPSAARQVFVDEGIPELDWKL